MKTSLNLAVMNAYMDIITINCLSFKIEDCDICNQFSINCDKFIDLFDNLMVNAKNCDLSFYFDQNTRQCKPCNNFCLECVDSKDFFI